MNATTVAVDFANSLPLPLDLLEPGKFACSVASMRLNYGVITSVDRDENCWTFSITT